MEDTYLNIDKYIGELITAVQKKYGTENVLFFLTSNTSANYPVEYLKEEFHLPADYFNVESAVALLNSYLNITFGEQKWIDYYDEYQIYLNRKLITKNKFSLNEFQTAVSTFIDEFEGVMVALPSFQLERGLQSNGMLDPFYKSFVKNRSGDCQFLLKEGWQPSFKFKKVNYTDQSHIPLIFYGANIQPIMINEKYDAVDLAPTLSHLMQIPIPDKSQGKIINELNR